MSIPDWLSWNQNSVFESQSEIDTWQGGICKSCRLLRSRPAGEERFFQQEGGVLFGGGFSGRLQRSFREGGFCLGFGGGELEGKEKKLQRGKFFLATKEKVSEGKVFLRW